LQFLTATDTNRKKFLIDLLRLEEYVQLFEVFKEASRESSNKMIEVSSEITTIEKWLSNNKLEATNILPLLNLEIDTDEDEKIFRSLSIELKNISEKNKKILRNNQYKEMLSKINIDELQSLPPVEKLSYDKFQNIIGQVEGAKRASDRMLQKLEQLEDKCPTCEQDIDADFKDKLIQAEKKTLGFLALQKKENEDIIEKIKKDNTEFARREKLQKEWEDLFRNIDNTLPSSILDADELQERLDEVTQKLKEAKAKLADIASQNEEITKRNTRIEIIEAQTDGFLKKLAAAKEVLNEQQELDSNLEILKKAFSTNGLLAYKIENLVKELEELANSYLAELSDGRFTLEFIVSNDKLNVQITDNENIVDILALSSGELARVNTATLIAIRKLMSSISKSRINILFLDEVINVLDESGREKMVEVLLQEDLNTYVVSHGWTHPLLEKIEVVKEGNVSKLEW
jgi:DNA repair exonuclease SbcCD ATPase subunit